MPAHRPPAATIGDCRPQEVPRMKLAMALAAVFTLMSGAGGTVRADDALASAAREGDSSTVRAVIAAGADLDAIGSDGATALHWAAARGYLDVVNLLLKAGADTEILDEREYSTPLQWAAGGGSADVVRALLKAGADTDAGEMPALHIAAVDGSVGVVKALVAAGADVNQLNADFPHGGDYLVGIAPMHLAAWHGQTDVIKVLLEAGADVNRKSRHGATPLDFVHDDDATYRLLEAAGGRVGE